MARTLLEPGYKIYDGRRTPKYEVVRELSQGNFGITYVVKNSEYPSLEHILKINKAHKDMDPSQVINVVYELSKEFDSDARTENEKNILLYLKHPNILKIIDFVEVGRGYKGIVTWPIEKPITLGELIMQFNADRAYSYRGKTSNTLIKKMLAEAEGAYDWFPHTKTAHNHYHNEQSPLEDFMSIDVINSRTYSQLFSIFHHYMHIFPQANSIINYLLRKRITHRDIHPGNILLDSELNMYLIDFGLSFPVKANPKTDHLAGKMLYRDPAFFLENKYSEYGDLWSWGLVFNELLTGQNLISGKPAEDSSREDVRDFLIRYAEARKSLGDLFNVHLKQPVSNVPIEIAGEYLQIHNVLEGLITSSFESIKAGFMALARYSAAPLLEDIPFSSRAAIKTETDRLIVDGYVNVLNGPRYEPLDSGYYYKNFAKKVIAEFDFNQLIAKDFLDEVPFKRARHLDYRKFHERMSLIPFV
jgi:serine/threonine protein kinase